MVAHESPECFRFPPGECHKPRISAERDAAAAAGESSAQAEDKKSKKKKEKRLFTQFLRSSKTSLVNPLHCVLLLNSLLYN